MHELWRELRNEADVLVFCSQERAKSGQATGLRHGLKSRASFLPDVWVGDWRLQCDEAMFASAACNMQIDTAELGSFTRILSCPPSVKMMDSDARRLQRACTTRK